MTKKNRILVLLISASLVMNIYLNYNFNKVSTELETINQSMLARADKAINDGVRNIGMLDEQWEEKSNIEKIRILGEVDSNLTLAMELMSRADKFFLPVKTYRNGLYTLERKIIDGSDKNIQKEYIAGLNNDFQILWTFLANFFYSDMTKEEAREKWKGEVKHLKTTEIK